MKMFETSGTQEDSLFIVTAARDESLTTRREAQVVG